MTQLSLFHKPCPHCGERENIRLSSDDGWKWLYVECCNCGARGGEARGRNTEEARAQAWVLWNTRVEVTQ